MELPTPKPIAEIEAMKEERRQGYRDNRQRIIDHLKTKGLSNAAIAGIVGNIDIETGGTFDYKQRQTKSGNPRDPNVTPGGAYGLFQFDDPGKKAGHETWYKQYLEKTNKTDSAESQLDYFLDTINAAADKQNPFYSFSENVGTGNTGTIKGYFQLSEDPKTVSDSITDRFLKPGKPKSDKRRASAEATFAELQPVDPDNQNIDQPGDIVDTGDDVPLPDTEERKFQNVPILRHFFAEGGMSTNDEDKMDKHNFPITEEILKAIENMTEEERRQFIDKAMTDAKKGSRYNPLPEDAKEKFKGLRRNYNKGGVAEQMEMFEDGGLMDEGGTVDPVSGNDVPFGSMQEEVRDDIPAQLSEGEFVFPADVVRFIGLNNLMQMRQQAKMGLKEMEAMGQMGNSEEATMPDDLPFDINDLDMEDDMDYNTPQEFNTGGMPNPQSGVFYQPATAPTTGVYQPPQMSVAPAPVQAASAQFAAPPRPQQVTTPMIQYQKPDIPFQQFIGGGVEGVEAETVQYKNEAGDIITRRISKATGELIPGQPPIPDGYVKFDPNAPEKEEVTTTPTTPQTTSVRPQDDDDGAAQKAADEAMYGPGGGRIGVAGEIYGVSFDMPEGFMPGVMGTFGTAASLFAGKPLPEGVTVKFKQGDDVFALSGTEYNTLKESIANNGANSEATQTTLKELRDSARSRQVVKNAAKMAEEAKKALETDGDDDKGIKLNEYDMAGNVVGTAVVTSKVARQIADEQDIEGVAYDYSGFPEAGDPTDFTPAPDPRTQQEDDPGESGGTPSQDFSAPSPAPSYSYGSGPRAKGGLIEKPKPKAKKMKRGGLASKK